MSEPTKVYCVLFYVDEARPAAIFDNREAAEAMLRDKKPQLVEEGYLEEINSPLADTWIQEVEIRSEYKPEEHQEP